MLKKRDIDVSSSYSERLEYLQQLWSSALTPLFIACKAVEIISLLQNNIYST
jgi:hypothetical protein